MFNLNKNEKYKKANDSISIYCEKDLGPWTYGFGFRKENKMKKIQHGGKNINSGYENGSNILKNDISKIYPNVILKLKIIIFY